MDAPVEWLNARIARRFDLMLEHGALAEAEANWARWNPSLPSMKAIGAPELMSHLHGEMTLAGARDAAIIASRQYAKRQRTWFRARMGNWRGIDPS
jgi:tRNA dimethylallyltransferase